MIFSPSSGCVSITSRSAGVSGPGFERMSAGIPILPMSWKSAPSSSRLSAFESSPSPRPTLTARSVIQRACEDVYSSFASSAFASASTVEMKVSSRLWKLPAFAIASFAWCATPSSRPSLRSTSSRSSTSAERQPMRPSKTSCAMRTALCFCGTPSICASSSARRTNALPRSSISAARRPSKRYAASASLS